RRFQIVLRAGGVDAAACKDTRQEVCGAVNLRNGERPHFAFGIQPLAPRTAEKRVFHTKNGAGKRERFVHQRQKYLYSLGFSSVPTRSPQEREGGFRGRAPCVQAARQSTKI